ncbi:hypothetical protein JOC77_002819 [Peribacillus deserti]|uniref:EF-hand domain-containing protein n=1 Tax=Peribacillus deserti TaxID=673318 RepID=A0ABS2QKY5_9BACI|nr:hypothetical protein [Peribacillus deserti]MBM7693379.1 hypothetical protein [Peribacillus deserti]
MEISQVKAIFEQEFYSCLFDQFSYQFQLTGLFDHIKDEDVIISFLSMYDFSQDQTIFYDDFRYFFKSYSYQYEKNRL